MSNIIKHERFCKSSVETNNNKFWYISLIDIGSSSYEVKTEYGRIGSSAAENTKSFSSQSEAECYYDKKIREKLSARNGEIPYRKLEVVSEGSVTTSTNNTTAIEVIAEKQIETDDDDTKKLIRYLVKENIHNITGSTTISYNSTTGQFSTPCGVVSKESIIKARDILNNIAKFVIKRDFHNRDYYSVLGDYLMLIPQDVGRKLNPETLYTSSEDIQKQNDILDSLTAAVDSATIVTNTKEEKIFDCKINKLKDYSIVKKLEKMYYDTRKSMHSCYHLKPVEFYTVDIKSMKEDFESVRDKYGNIKSLWHGTKTGNLLSILRKGLIIPPANASYVCGRMFGNGLYFASDSTKSLNYAYGYWSGNRNNNCFMFVADVCLGRAYTPKHSGSDRPAGYDSIWAKSGISGVMNDEFIVPKTNMCNLQYLIKFSDK